LTYLEPKQSLLALFYNDIFVIIKIIIVFMMYVYIFSSHNGWRVCTNWIVVIV
jgi:hypothetical protein